MTIQEALQWARGRLHASSSANEDARLLLQQVLQVGHSYIAAHPEQTLTPQQVNQFQTLVARAAQLEPIPYIIGEANFYGLEFIVTPDVLIPRPETEQLVDEAIAWAESRTAPFVVDVGTGSGCIAVLLARRLPHADILAVDVSKEALQVARRNLERHDVVNRVRLQQASLLDRTEEPVDLIVANLPYISDPEWTAVDDAVKWYEPVSALRGGPDGLDFIGRLLQQASTQLRVGGAIFLEIGWRQGEAARKLAKTFFPEARITVRSDYAGHDRIVVIETSG